MQKRRLSFVLVWTSFYEQLAWVPVLTTLAAAAGDVEAVALAASAYSLANLLGNLGFGLAADRTSRYRVAGAGLIGMAVTAGLHLVASTPGALVAVRFLHGITAAAVAPAALAVVTDGAPGDRRGQVMARVGMVIAVASMMAPPVTGRLAGALGVGATIGLLAAVLALVGVVSLVAGARPEAVAPVPERAPGLRVGVLSLPLALAASAAAFALMFGQNVLFYGFPLRTRALGMSPASTGALLSAFAVGAFIAFLPPLSRMADRFGRLLPLLLGLGLSATGLFTLAQVSAPPLLATGLLVYGLGFGLVFPAVSALSADAAGRSHRGLAFGVLTAAFSAGAITGPLVSKAMAGLLQPFTVAGMVAILGAAMMGALLPQGRPRPRNTGV